MKCVKKSGNIMGECPCGITTCFMGVHNLGSFVLSLRPLVLTKTTSGTFFTE